MRVKEHSTSIHTNSRSADDRQRHGILCIHPLYRQDQERRYPIVCHILERLAFEQHGFDHNA